MADSSDPKPKKTVLITGCSEGGLGEALAVEFHGKGLRVLATARKIDAMQALTTLGIETFELDVTDSKSIDSALIRVSEMTNGKLDILVNNAGITYPFPFTDVTMDKVKELFDINLFGAMAMAQKYLPLLLASSEARILQIGSLSGIMPTPYGAAYNASKAALHSFGDSLRVELAPFGIKVTTVILGNVKTNITKPWHVLPDTSMYQPIRAEYQSSRIDNFHASAIPREPVARKIVAEVLNRNPRAWLWAGANSWIAWFISTFLGRKGFDGILSRMFGLKKLAAINATRNKHD